MKYKVVKEFNVYQNNGNTATLLVDTIIDNDFFLTCNKTQRTDYKELLMQYQHIIEFTENHTDQTQSNENTSIVTPIENDVDFTPQDDNAILDNKDTSTTNENIVEDDCNIIKTPSDTEQKNADKKETNTKKDKKDKKEAKAQALLKDKSQTIAKMYK